MKITSDTTLGQLAAAVSSIQAASVHWTFSFGQNVVEIVATNGLVVRVTSPDLVTGLADAFAQYHAGNMSEPLPLATLLKG